MMYFIVRLIFAIIIFIIFYLIIKKSKIVNKKACVTILFFSVIVLLNVLYFIPVENSFISFPSAEKAFTYANKQTSKDILCVVDGKETTLIIAASGDSYIEKVFPKTEKGWKINTGLKTNPAAMQHYNSFYIKPYTYKDSSDRFIKIVNLDGGETKISDNRNSQFQCVKGEFIPASGKTMFYYYTCVQATDDEYIISLNGEEISLSLTENIPPTTVLNTQ